MGRVRRTDVYDVDLVGLDQRLRRVSRGERAEALCRRGGGGGTGAGGELTRVSSPPAAATACACTPPMKPAPMMPARIRFVIQITSPLRAARLHRCEWWRGFRLHAGNLCLYYAEVNLTWADIQSGSTQVTSKGGRRCRPVVSLLRKAPRSVRVWTRCSRSSTRSATAAPRRGRRSPEPAASAATSSRSASHSWSTSAC